MNVGGAERQLTRENIDIRSRTLKEYLGEVTVTLNLFQQQTETEN